MRPVVTWWRLRPYSPAVLTALAAIDSPFVGDTDRQCTLADVQLAAKICAAKDPFAADLRPTLRDHLIHISFHKNECYVRDEAQKLMDYLSAP